MPHSLSHINAMSQEEFVATLGSIFEGTPAIAATTWQFRPFATVQDCHQRMVAVMEALPADAQLALVRAHPDLGSRMKMAEASVREQSGLGLDRLSPEEYVQWQSLNQSYTSKFGFPFIIAVRGQTKETVLQAFQTRLQNSVEQEMATALQEIAKIAQFRLMDAIVPA